MASEVSPDLLWAVIRNNNSFLLKGNGQTYSRERNNLKARHSFRYNGLIHKKTVGVQPCKDGKGVVLVTRKAKVDNKPGKTYTRVPLRKNSRKTLTTINKTMSAGRYRTDLKMAAARRASALLKSQKPVAIRKTVRKRKA